MEPEMKIEYKSGNRRVDYVIGMIEGMSWYELEKLYKHLPHKLQDYAYRGGWEDGKEYAEHLNAQKTEVKKE